MTEAEIQTLISSLEVKLTKLQEQIRNGTLSDYNTWHLLGQDIAYKNVLSDLIAIRAEIHIQESIRKQDPLPPEIDEDQVW